MKSLSHKTFFYIDAFGALLSSFLLGIVLVKFQVYFGIPKSTLYTLAIIPFCFLLYDLYCLVFVKNQLFKYLKVIAYLNSMYCVVSLVLVLSHFKEVTTLGWLYIIIEIVIVLILSKAELNAANKH